MGMKQSSNFVADEIPRAQEERRAMYNQFFKTKKSLDILLCLYLYRDYRYLHQSH